MRPGDLRSGTCRYHKMALYQWILKVMGFLLVAPGAAVSQIPSQDLCTSPISIGGRIFIEDIPEDLAVDSTIGNLQLQGSPTEIAITYLQPHNPNVNFDPVSQNLTIIAPLDREAYNFIDITIQCEMLERGFKISVPVKITILDVNDNHPQFLGNPYTTEISELMPVGTTILSGIAAFDPDIDNWKISFEVLEDGPYATYFSFPIETSGNLVLIKPLDYEEVHTIELHIVAKDHHPDVLGRGQVQLNSTALATIHLYDGDDQNPAFTSPSYLAYVTENAPVGTAIEVLPGVTAYDLDFGLNATLSYSLVPDTIHMPPYSSYFQMDNVTASIMLGSNVLRRGEQFCLLVKATQVDNPNRYTMTSLFILVQAANENRPRFLQKEYKMTLVENVPAGSYVTTVSAIDNDVGTVLTYGFRNPLLVTDFVIDPKLGEIVTSQSLSYERTSSYNLSVSVTDGKWYDYAYLIVTLVNINNNNPMFLRDVYSFQGYKQPNFYVGKVQATDLDVGSVVTYSFAENNTNFRITAGGDIYITDYDSIGDDDVMTLCVTAEDEGTPPRRDVSLARVTFGVGASPVTAQTEADLVVIIILGVLAGCLLLIIIVLAIYIYRKKRKSFERGINELPTGYKNTYMDPTEGVYKPTTRDRHLALYNDLHVDHDATTIQENPFQQDNDSEAGTTYAYPPPPPPHEYVNQRSSYTGTSNQSVGPSDPSSNYSSRQEAGIRGMHAVNEIDYDTAVAPMDTRIHRRPPIPLKDSYSSGSEPSFMGSGGSLGTFKVGNSTQALVPPHSPVSSGYRGKGSSVSFIDDHQVNLYNPDNVINPMSGAAREKPEITVYY